jgi:hypothetical protein
MSRAGPQSAPQSAPPLAGARRRPDTTNIEAVPGPEAIRPAHNRGYGIMSFESLMARVAAIERRGRASMRNHTARSVKKSQCRVCAKDFQ